MTSLPHRAGPATPEDRARLEQLVRALYPAVWRLCACLVDDAAAQDLVQETFLRATQLGTIRSRVARAREDLIALAEPGRAQQSATGP